MRIYSVAGPDGRIYDVEGPEGASEAQVIAAVEAQLASTASSGDKSGFFPALKGGIAGLKSAAGALTGRTGLESPEDATARRARAQAEGEAAFAPTQEGWLEAPWTKIKELAGGSLPYMAAPLAGAIAGAPLGPVGAGAGALLAGLAQYTGTNLDRQLEEAERAGKPLGVEETNLGPAVAAAAPQAVLDVVGFRAIPLIRQLFKQTGKEISEQAALALAKKNLAKPLRDYTLATGRAAGTEGLTEVGQQMLERLQAGLSVTDASAKEEAVDALIGGVVLGGAIAPAGRYVERMGERQKVANAERKKASEALGAQETAAEEAKAAERAAPDYLPKLAQRYTEMKTQRAALQKRIDELRKVAKEDPASAVMLRTAIKELDAFNHDIVRPVSKEMADAGGFEAVKAKLPLQPEFPDGQQAQGVIPILKPGGAPALDPQRPIDADATGEEGVREQRRGERLAAMEAEGQAAATTRDPERGDALLARIRQAERNVEDAQTVYSEADAAGRAAARKRYELAAQQLQQLRVALADSGYKPPPAPPAVVDVEKLQKARDAMGPGPDFDPAKAMRLEDKTADAEKTNKEATAAPELPAMDSDLFEERRQAAREQLDSEMQERSDLLTAAAAPPPEVKQTPYERMMLREADKRAGEREVAAEEEATSRYELDHVVPLIENLLDRDTGNVAAPPSIKPIPNASTLVGRLNDLQAAVDDAESRLQTAKDSGMRGSGGRQSIDAVAQERDTARRTLNEMSKSGGPAQAILALRRAQEGALLDAEMLLDDLKSGQPMGGRRGTITKGSAIESELRKLRDRYIRLMTTEAAITRKLHDKALTKDEAAAAAAEVSRVFDEWIARVKAAPRSAETTIRSYKRDSGAADAGWVDAARKAFIAERMRMALPEKIAGPRIESIEAGNPIERGAETVLTPEDRVRITREATAEFNRALEAMQPRPPVYEGTGPQRVKVDPGKSVRVDTRPPERRRFGAYRQAAQVLREQIGAVRERLTGIDRTSTRESPLLRTQFASTEATKTAEARGETAKTRGGELRRRREFVGDLIDKALRERGMLPAVRDALERAAAAIEEGKGSTDVTSEIEGQRFSAGLLDAAEELATRVLEGRKERTRTDKLVQEIDTALRVEEDRAGEGEVAGTRDNARYDEEGNEQRLPGAQRDIFAPTKEVEQLDAEITGEAGSPRARIEAQLATLRGRKRFDNVKEAVGTLRRIQALEKQLAELPRDLSRARSVAESDERARRTERDRLKGDVGFVRATAKAFENAPAVKKARAVIDNGKRLLEGIRKELTRLDAENREAAKKRKKALEEKAAVRREYMQDAFDLALLRAREAVKQQRRAAVLERFKERLDEARKNLAVIKRQRTNALKVPNKEYARDLDAIIEVEENALAALRSEIDSEIAKLDLYVDATESAPLIAADEWLAVEREALAKAERALADARPAARPAALSEIEAARLHLAAAETAQRSALNERSALSERRLRQQTGLGLAGKRRVEGKTVEIKSDEQIAEEAAAAEADQRAWASMEAAANAADRERRRGQIVDRIKTLLSDLDALKSTYDKSKSTARRTKYLERGNALNTELRLKQAELEVFDKPLERAQKTKLRKQQKTGYSGRSPGWAALDKEREAAILVAREKQRLGQTLTPADEELLARADKDAERIASRVKRETEAKGRLEAKAEAIAQREREKAEAREILADSGETDVTLSPKNPRREAAQLNAVENRAKQLGASAKAQAQKPGVASAEELLAAFAKKGVKRTHQPDAPFDGMTFAEAARWGAGKTNSGLSRHLFNILAAVFDRMPADFGTRRVYAIKEQGGYYVHAHNAVLSAGPANTGYLKTLLHELTHAATVYAVDNNFGLNTRTRLLRERVEAWLETPEGKAYFRKHSMALGKNRQSIYGLKNNREFLAELFSDREFQKMLRQIPSEKKGKSVLTRFVETVANFFGLTNKNEVSLFEEALALSEEVLAETTKIAASDKGVVSPATAAYMAASESPLNFARADAAGWSPDFKDVGEITAKVVGRDKTLMQKVRENLLGLNIRTQLLDKLAPLEKVVFGHMESLKAVQIMSFLRLHDQRMHVTGETLALGAPKIVKKMHNGRATWIVEAQDGVNIKNMVQELADPALAKIVGSPDKVNELFTTYLGALRARRVGVAALNFAGDVKEADLEATIAKVEGNETLKKAFESVRKQYNRYNRDLLNFAVETGAMAPALRDKLVDSDDYIPYYRVQENGIVNLMIGGETPFHIGNIKDSPHLQELVGGDEKIYDFLTSSVRNTAMLLDMSLRNLAVKNAMLGLADTVVEGKPLAKIREAKKKGNVPLHAVEFSDKGKDYYAIVDTDRVGVPSDLLVKGMEGIPTMLPGIVRAMGGASRLLRRSVVSTPVYMARQMIRDTVAATMTSGADFVPVLSALKQRGKDNPLARRGVTGGQVFTGMPEDMSRLLKEMQQGRPGWARALSKMEEMAMRADALTRRAQYQSYLDQGLSEMEATYMSLESMNFSKRGLSPSVHFFAQLIPFMNAQLQGLDVIYKSLAGKMPLNERLQIREKLITRGLFMMATSMAYAALMQDDEAYKNALPEHKYGNWFLRVPGFEEPVRIPIPFELGYIFKAIPEAIVNILMDDTGTAAEQARKAMFAIGTQLVPGLNQLMLPQAVKPGIEVAANYSFFTGRELETDREAAMEPEERYRDKTTELAKLIGKANLLSPIQVEHLVRGYTGSLGMMALALGDAVIPTSGPEKPTRNASDTPLFGTLFQPNDASGLIDATFKRLERAERIKKTFEGKLAKGNVEEARAYLDKNIDEFALAPMGNDYRKAMGEIADAAAAFRSSDLSPDEKRARLKELRQIQIDLAKTFRAAAERSTRPAAP